MKQTSTKQNKNHRQDKYIKYLGTLALLVTTNNNCNEMLWLCMFTNMLDKISFVILYFTWFLDSVVANKHHKSPHLRVSVLQYYIGPVYKTNLVRTKSLSDHGPVQIWLCKRYLSVPKIWSGPKRDLLMCKDHGPIEFGPVPNLDM